MSAESERADAIAQRMRVLGQAYRGDWRDFDGRTLKEQLQEMASSLIRPEEPMRSYESWCAMNAICPTGHHWLAHCTECCEPICEPINAATRDNGETT